MRCMLSRWTWLTVILLIITSSTGRAEFAKKEEIVFDSGSFRIVGDLKFPEGKGPFPVVLFVHGDGSNNRSSGVTYPPIMNRMLRAGFATFAWDKPGTGESTGQIDRSRLGKERAQIVLDAIAAVKERSDIDPQRIGMWGISQAGYVMPRVLAKGDDVAFMIAVSCPGEAGIEQGAYLLTAQAVCAGLPVEDAERVKHLISAASRAQTYDDYVRYKALLAEYPILEEMTLLGFRSGVRPEEEWHPDDPSSEYFWDPMGILVQTTIPVLAFFGEKDTQADPIQGAEAYRAALNQAGHPLSRVELIPDADHNIIKSDTGCLDERSKRSRSEWTDYAPDYLDIIEEWLGKLPR